MLVRQILEAALAIGQGLHEVQRGVPHVRPADEAPDSGAASPVPLLQDEFCFQ